MPGESDDDLVLRLVRSAIGRQLDRVYRQRVAEAQILSVDTNP